MKSNPVMLVVAPHPDDETLGPGGTLLRRRAEGWDVHWLIVTTADEYAGFGEDQRAQRRRQIEEVAKLYNFAAVHRGDLPAAGLDGVSEARIHQVLSAAIGAVNPDEVLLPYAGDPHSDHRIVSQIGWSCCKSFRAPSVRRVMMYETPSETDFAQPGMEFRPNVFVDTTGFVERKLEIMAVYEGELRAHPFPRSVENLKARATQHGAIAQCESAEAFVLAREIDRMPDANASSSEGDPRRSLGSGDDASVSSPATSHDR